MRGVVFTGNRGVEVREFAYPAPGTDEIVIKVRASGMCGSDLHTYRSAPAGSTDALLIQGHEPSGVVEELGANVDPRIVSVGDRVVVHHYWGCTVCEQCRAGWPQLCTTAEPRVPTLNEQGAHADYMRIPAIQAFRLPESLSFNVGAALGCGTGTAWGALERVGDVAGKTVVVIGQGPVGLSVTMFASSFGARVIAVDIASGRLDRAGSFGAEEVVNSSEVDMTAAVLDLTGGRGADVIIETSGNSIAAAQALEIVATWGKLCLVGIGADVVFNTKDTLRRQLTVLTSWTLSTVALLKCITFVDTHHLPVDELFTHRWTLSEADAAYRWFDQQSDGKGVFEA